VSGALGSECFRDISTVPGGAICQDIRESELEGVSYGPWPVPDRNPPADWPAHQGVGGRPRGERELALKLLRRYRLEGPAGLEPRSRRPKTSPTRIADLYEEEIVRWRKELERQGFDAGAETIHFHMSTPGRNVPSVSTIPPGPRSPGLRHHEPKNDPTPPEGVVFEILNVIDDHYRVCVASLALS
jgi:hypothetical protein